MARFSSAVLVLFIAALASTTIAAPVSSGVNVVNARDNTPATPATKANSKECSQARLTVIGALASTVGILQTVSSTDPATQSAVQTAKTALMSSGEGVQTIANVVLSGGQPSQATRQKISEGMTQAKAALTGLNSSDPSIVNTLKSLDMAMAAGQVAKQECATRD